LIDIPICEHHSTTNTFWKPDLAASSPGIVRKKRLDPVGRISLTAGTGESNCVERTPKK
jgi:hypothetical protein